VSPRARLGLLLPVVGLLQCATAAPPPPSLALAPSLCFTERMAPGFVVRSSSVRGLDPASCGRLPRPPFQTP